jgi:hypothetical protein
MYISAGHQKDLLELTLATDITQFTEENKVNIRLYKGYK